MEELNRLLNYQSYGEFCEFSGIFDNSKSA